MRIVGLKINSRETKDNKEIEQIFYFINKAKNHIKNYAEELETLIEIKFEVSGENQKPQMVLEVDEDEMNRIFGGIQHAQNGIAENYKRLEECGAIRIVHNLNCIRHDAGSGYEYGR